MWPFLFSLLLTTPLIALCAFQEYVLDPRLRKELSDLNARRAKRVQQALAANTDSEWPESSPTPGHPFSRWVELLPNGIIRIAGQTLSANQSFHIAARDDHNICRATATSQGIGDVLINSQGQTFIAQYANSQWRVQPTNTLL